jgi:LysR family glycine cleavage system transcriptional activator
MSEIHPNAPGGEGRLPLPALRAFEAAARLGSFRAAAAEIGLTPSAISHHVRDLEGGLGVRLFTRAHRELVLTEAGTRLAARLTPALASIAAAWRDARSNKVLRLSAAPLFAARFLLPRLGELAALLPDTTIHVESAITPVDLVNGEHDLALRFGPEPSAPLMAAPLGGGGFMMVAAPGLAARVRSNGPSSLDDIPLLSLTRLPNAWAEVFVTLGIEGRRRELLFDAHEGVLRAAEEGLGVALLPPVVCQDQLAAGTLVRLLDRLIDNGWSYWLVGRPDVLPARQMRRLAGWLTQQINPNTQKSEAVRH